MSKLIQDQSYDSMHLLHRFIFVSVCSFMMFLTSLLADPSAFGKENCEAYYFGINRAPDFPRALRCYEAEKNWEFLILMYLNGEGSAVDVQKADELFRTWQKAEPDRADSLQAKALQKAIEERKQHAGKTYPRLDYCHNIANDTNAINFCGSIDAQIGEAKAKTVWVATRTRLTRSQGTIFDRLVAEFKVFEEAEGGRMYQRYSGGTVRNIASMGQVAFIREHFLTLIRDTVDQRGLKPADENEFIAADLELNQVYSDDIAKYTRDSDVGEMAAYRKESKNAQLHWIQYRDLWADLARALYKGGKQGFDPADSVKTAVTRIRVLELRNDPVGPG